MKNRCAVELFIYFEMQAGMTVMQGMFQPIQAQMAQIAGGGGMASHLAGLPGLSRGGVRAEVGASPPGVTVGLTTAQQTQH